MQALLLRPYFRYAGLGVTAFAEGHFRFTNDMVFELRQLNYVEQWKRSHAMRWFHVLLEDSSFFAFSTLGGKPSYSYYPCPLEIETLREFLLARDIEPTKRNRLEFIEEYQLAIETAPLREFLTPIRYDIDRSSYRVCIHPYAHLHIGWDNQIRIATRRVMTPLAFVLFVIRQIYPDNWSRLLEQRAGLRLVEKIRTELEEVIDPYWQADDEFQTYLN